MPQAECYFSNHSCSARPQAELTSAQSSLEAAAAERGALAAQVSELQRAAAAAAQDAAQREALLQVGRGGGRGIRHGSGVQ